MIFKSRINQKQSKCIFCQSVRNQTAVKVNVLSSFLFATWGSSLFNLHASCSAPPIRGPQHEVPDHGGISSIAVMSGYTRLAPHAIRDSNCILLGGSAMFEEWEPSQTTTQLKPGFQLQEPLNGTGHIACLRMAAYHAMPGSLGV